MSSVFVVHRQLCPASAVSQSVFGRFTGTTGPEIAIARANAIEIYAVRDATLELRASCPLDAAIESLCLVPRKNKQDALLVTVRVGRVSLVDFNKEAWSLRTLSVYNFEEGATGRGAVDLGPCAFSGTGADETRPMACVDGRGVTAAVFVRGRVVLIDLTEEDAKPCALVLEEICGKGRGCCLEHLCFLEDTVRPTLCLAYSEAMTSSTRVLALEVGGLGGLTKKKKQQSKMRHAKIWEAAGLPDCLQFCCPTPRGGFLCLFPNLIALVDDGATLGLALNAWAPLDVASETRLLPNPAKLSVEIGNGGCGAFVGDDEFVLACDGAMWLVSTNAEAFSVAPLARGPVASCLAVDRRRKLLFVGSAVSDSLLSQFDLRFVKEAEDAVVKVETTTEEDSEAMLLYGRPLSSSTPKPPTPHLDLKVTDTLIALGASVDATFAVATVAESVTCNAQEEEQDMTSEEACSLARETGRSSLLSLGADGSLASLVGGAHLEPALSFDLKSRCLEMWTYQSDTDVLVCCEEGPPHRLRRFAYTGEEASLAEIAPLTGSEEAPLAVWLTSTGVAALYPESGLCFFEEKTGLLTGTTSLNDLLGGGDEEMNGRRLVRVETSNTVCCCLDSEGTLYALENNSRLRVLGEGYVTCSLLCAPASTFAEQEEPRRRVSSVGSKMVIDDDEEDEESRWLYGVVKEEQEPLEKKRKIVNKEEALATLIVAVPASGGLALLRADTGAEVYKSGSPLASSLMLLRDEEAGDEEEEDVVDAFLQLVGPTGCVELQRYCLAVVRATGDLAVFVWRGGFVKLEHDFIGRAAQETDAPLRSLRPRKYVHGFTDESRAGLRLALPRPAWLLCDKGLPAIIRHATPIISAETRFACLESGVLALTDARTVHLCAVEGLSRLLLPSSPSKLLFRKSKPPGGGKATKIAALGPPPQGVVAAPFLVALVERAFEEEGLVPADSSVASKSEARPDDCMDPATQPPIGAVLDVRALADDSFGGVVEPTEPRHEVVLMSSIGYRAVQRFGLMPGERAADLCTITWTIEEGEEGEKQSVEKQSVEKQSVEKQSVEKQFVGVGTAVPSEFGEDGAAKGRLLIFRVDYEEEPKLEVVCSRELKGVVSALRQLGDFLILSSGPRVEVYQWRNNDLRQVAIHQAQTCVASIRVLKNYVLYADVYASVHLLYWRESDKLLSLLAKDDESARRSVNVADFVVGGASKQQASVLGLAVTEVGGALRLLQYAPKVASSSAMVAGQTRGAGQRLSRRAIFALHSEAKVALTHKLSSSNKRWATVFADLEGGVSALIPIQEKTFRRLFALHGVMTNALQHSAALHPDRNGLESPRTRNVLDGALLWRYVTLPPKLQADLAAAIGSSTTVILDSLLQIDREADFL